MAIQRAELHPHLDLRESAARREGAVSEANNRRCTLSNGFMDVQINLDPSRRQHARFLNKVSGETFELEFLPFRAWFDGVETSGAEARLMNVEARGSSHAASTTALLSYEWFDAEILFVLQRGDHYLQKRVVIRNVKKPVRLRRMSLFTHHVSSEYETVLHDGGLYAPIVFMRGNQGGLFFCLDFPCYFATHESGTFSFDYYPGCIIEPGRSYQTLTAHLGVYERLGRSRSNPYHPRGGELDVGEQQWFRAYLEHAAPSPNEPVLEIMGPDPGSDGPSDLEVLGQCAALGVDRAVLSRVARCIDAYPHLDLIKRTMQQHNIVGKYIWARDDLSKMEELRGISSCVEGDAKAPDGRPYLIADPARDSVLDHQLSMLERHRLFTEIEVVGTPLVPSPKPEDADFYEFESRELLHKAFQSLVDLTATLRESFGQITAGGPYSCYGIGTALLFDAISPMVEPHPLPLPDLHPARLYADMGRLYFRRSHDFLLPKTHLVNTIGFPEQGAEEAPYPGSRHYPWSLYHDAKGWRYALISAIATGMRHRFFPLPMDATEDDLAFARTWLKWEKEHAEDLREVEEILGEPELGSVDGYSYVTGRSAILFLFNNSYDGHEKRLNLCLAHDSDYVVRELYPREMNYLGPNEGLYRKDSEITLHLEPREARIIEAVRRSPAAAKRKRPEVFGAPSREVKGKTVVTGFPGERITVGVRTGGRFRTQDVRFPGQRFRESINEWTVAQRDFEEGRPTLTKGAFPGKPLSQEAGRIRDAWLCARVHPPTELAERLDCSKFHLDRPAWTYPKRLFFFVRFEPESFFDPIRTASDMEGIPECFMPEQTIKCGIDLAPLNIGLRAWINGRPCSVYPAMAVWRRYSPNTAPVVGYFFEAGSKLAFGARNHVVLYARNFDASMFKGIIMENLPDLSVEKALDLS